MTTILTLLTPAFDFIAHNPAAALYIVLAEVHLLRALEKLLHHKRLTPALLDLSATSLYGGLGTNYMLGAH